jgi:hypothetical protein
MFKYFYRTWEQLRALGLLEEDVGEIENLSVIEPDDGSRQEKSKGNRRSANEDEDVFHESKDGAADSDVHGSRPRSQRASTGPRPQSLVETRKPSRSERPDLCTTWCTRRGAQLIRRRGRLAATTEGITAAPPLGTTFNQAGALGVVIQISAHDSGKDSLLIFHGASPTSRISGRTVEGPNAQSGAVGPGRHFDTAAGEAEGGRGQQFVAD